MASSYVSGLAVALFLVVFAISVAPNHADNIDIDIGNKSGNKICIGNICDDSTIFHYYVCCGKLLNECCFRLQLWVWIALGIIAFLAVAGALGGVIKCICCCDR